jgi:hypothetical protein
MLEMPCSCDHYEPNEREKELNKAAKCYIWFTDKLNKIYEEEDLAVCMIGVSKGMEKAAESEWGSGCGDTVAELCNLIHRIGEDMVKEIVNKNFSDPMSGQLMSWWSKHQFFDKRESVLASIATAVWKSDDKEIDGILEINPDLEDEISKVIAEKVFKHQVRERKYGSLTELQKAFTIIPDTNRFKRFIKQEHWTELASEYDSVPVGVKLQPKHHELAGMSNFYTTHVNCPDCGVSAGEWCSKSEHKICDGRKDLWYAELELKTRTFLGYPV